MEELLERAGEGAPDAVREVAEPGPTDIAIGAPHVDVPPSLGE